MTTLPVTEILLLHVVLALAALAVVGSARWWIRRGANHDMPARPIEVACPLYFRTLTHKDGDRAGGLGSGSVCCSPLARITVTR